MSGLSVSFKQEQAHDDSIWSCAFGRNERDPSNSETVISGSIDDYVKVWKWQDDKLELRHTLEGHQLGVVSVDINSDGSLAASSSLDSHVRIWDLESGKMAKSIDAGPVDAWTVAFSPDSRFLASGSHTGKINLFGVDSGRKESSMDTRGKFTLSLCYSPDGKYVASGALDGFVNVFDVATEKLLHTLEAPNMVALAQELAKDHKALQGLHFQSQKKFRLFHPDQRASLKTGHAMPIRSLCFSPDSQLLITASDDCQIKIYDVQHGNLAGTLSGHGSWVLSVDFCADNSHFVSGSSDKTVKIWNAGTRQCVHTFYDHTDQVWGVKYNPSGSKIVSVSEDHSINVYDCPL